MLALAGGLGAAAACATDETPATERGRESPASTFTLKDMNGADVKLADFKGRPLLINFWATWCGPCKHEIPMFVELVEKYQEQKFTVLGHLDRRHARGSAAVRGRVQDELPGARRRSATTRCSRPTKPCSRFR